MKNYDLKGLAVAIRGVTSEILLARGYGHIGGSFSIVETLAVIFGKYMRDDPKDWFILSKGHAGPAYYAALMVDGKLDYDLVTTLNRDKTLLPSHPDSNLTPGVDCSTGSLGQGISQAVGLAFACKKLGHGARVYCIVGDGEMNEGETLEALEFAAHKHLDNLIIFIDCNKKQVDGLVSGVSCDIDYMKLMESLHLGSVWADGQDVEDIEAKIQMAIDDPEKAWVILLDTIKGQGIDHFAEMDNCHHVNFNEKDAEALRDYIADNKEVIERVMETD